MCSLLLRRRLGRGFGDPLGNQSGVIYGRTPSYNAGTAGDIFVDGVNGDDGNDGLTTGTAVATITEGLAKMAALSGVQTRTVRVMGDGVRYREFVDYTHANATAANAVVIAGYGTDLPYISGAEVVTGWTQCDSGDEALLGANYASIYKTDIDAADVEHDEFWRMLLSEDGEPLALASRRSNTSLVPFIIDSVDTMFRSDEDATVVIGVDGSGYVATITHPDVLGDYSDAQLAETVAAVHVKSNFTRHIRTTSASASVLTMEATSYKPENVHKYQLLNILPEIQEGGWGYTDNGDGTVTLYCWPLDTANLTDGIEIAVRESALQLYAFGGDSIHVESIGLEMCSAPDGSNSNMIEFNQTSNLSMNQCIVDRYSSMPGHMLNMKLAGDCAITNSTMRRAQGAYGVGLGGGSSSGYANNRVMNMHMEDMSLTSVRPLNQHNYAVVDILAIRTSAGSHANTTDHKQKSDKGLFLNFNCSMAPGERPLGGYATHQTSSRVLHLHCTYTGADDGRSLVDQTPTSGAIPDTGDNYVINCWTPHEPAIYDSENGGFTLGNDNPLSGDWHVYNCVVPDINELNGATVYRANNILTDASATGDASESMVADIDTLHVDAANGDWRAVAGGLLTTHAGFDVESVIATYEAWFPDIDLRRDSLNRVWNPADPGVGPYGKVWATS